MVEAPFATRKLSKYKYFYTRLLGTVSLPGTNQYFSGSLDSLVQSSRSKTLLDAVMDAVDHSIFEDARDVLRCLSCGPKLPWSNHDFDPVLRCPKIMRFDPAVCVLRCPKPSKILCCRCFFCVLPSCIISSGLVSYLDRSYFPGAHLPKQSFCIRKLNQNL